MQYTHNVNKYKMNIVKCASEREREVNLSLTKSIDSGFITHQDFI